MAESIFNALLDEHGLAADFQAASAGTAASPGMPAARSAIETVAVAGLNLEDHQSTPVSDEVVSEAALILTMTQGHKSEMIRRFPEAAGRIYTLGEYAGEPFGADWEVADPIGGDRHVYEACSRELRSALLRVVDRLNKDGLN